MKAWLGRPWARVVVAIVGVVVLAGIIQGVTGIGVADGILFGLGFLLVLAVLSSPIWGSIWFFTARKRRRS